VQWLFPFDPALIGAEGIELVLGKGSGAANVVAALAAEGLSLSTSGIRALLEQLKKAAIARHGLLNRKDLVSMAMEVGATAAQENN